MSSRSPLRTKHDSVECIYTKIAAGVPITPPLLSKLTCTHQKRDTSEDDSTDDNEDSDEDTTLHETHLNHKIRAMMTTTEVSKAQVILATVGSKNPKAMLLALSPERFKEIWHHLATTRCWKPSVQAGYIGTLLATARTITPMFPTLAALILHMKHAKNELQLKREPDWDPTMPEHVATASEIANLLTEPLAAPLVVTWLTGQRLGDILRLETKNLKVVRTETWTSLALTVTRGKTVRTQGPFTIHIPLDSTAARILGTLVLSQHSAQLPYVFLPCTRVEVTAENHAVLRAERTLKHIYRKTYWSIRRGALSLVGMTGKYTSTEQRTVSRHAGDPMLTRYLGAGVFDKHTALTQLRILSDLDRAVTTTTQQNCSVWRLQDLI